MGRPLEIIMKLIMSFGALMGHCKQILMIMMVATDNKVSQQKIFTFMKFFGTRAK
ncbi:hypothetical protein PHJA_000307000 [Phtheirospermum japonicum]|uniref:Uncharacterized protein n=1 Tax=Phtheirospermum japonicum TaxID=374723 RepID=A0A830B3D6_9LAMI|nr:hypothetical protein PHJA_000307000 [Phtheirospermum japonicum]